MSRERPTDPIEGSLENHELAVKRTLDSLGQLEDRFSEIVSDISKDEQEQLEPVGRALETHIERLEALVQTLDDHKRAVRDDLDEGVDTLATAIERSRRRAQHEPTPPGSELGDEPQDGQP